MGASTVEALASVATAAITIVPATMAAIWSRRANKNSNAALHEVKSNGGPSDNSQPTLKDYVQESTSKINASENQISRVEGKVDVLTRRFDQHLTHSETMDRALAEIYLDWKTRPAS